MESDIANKSGHKNLACSPFTIMAPREELIHPETDNESSTNNTTPSTPDLNNGGLKQRKSATDETAVKHQVPPTTDGVKQLQTDPNVDPDFDPKGFEKEFEDTTIVSAKDGE
jgi:hypothetical protein